MESDERPPEARPSPVLVLPGAWATHVPEVLPGSSLAKSYLKETFAD